MQLADQFYCISKKEGEPDFGIVFPVPGQQTGKKKPGPGRIAADSDHASFSGNDFSHCFLQLPLFRFQMLQSFCQLFPCRCQGKGMPA